MKRIYLVDGTTSLDLDGEVLSYNDSMLLASSLGQVIGMYDNSCEYIIVGDFNTYAGVVFYWSEKGYKVSMYEEKIECDEKISSQLETIVVDILNKLSSVDIQILYDLTRVYIIDVVSLNVKSAVYNRPNGIYSLEVEKVLLSKLSLLEIWLISLYFWNLGVCNNEAKILSFFEDRGVTV